MVMRLYKTLQDSLCCLYFSAYSASSRTYESHDIFRKTYQNAEGLLPSGHDVLLVAELILELLPSDVCFGNPLTGVHTVLFNLVGPELRPLVCEVFVDAKVVGDPWRIMFLIEVKRDADKV
jgi:hypothetical protein